MILHELGNAYHDQVLGFDEPRIRRAYEAFEKSGHGDVVHKSDGSFGSTAISPLKDCKTSITNR